MKFNIIDNSYQIVVDFNGEYSMNELETHLDWMVLKYVKKNKPTVEQFEMHVSEISYGFDMDDQNYESEYRNKKMITAGYDDDLILTTFGETILKDIQRQNNKEWVQIIAPVGALIITTVTLVFSIVIGF